MTAQNTLNFYATPPHECAYIPEREAVTLFADPKVAMDIERYTQLIAHGFRRSGDHVYSPYCNNCQACISVRIPVIEFRQNRSQRRCWRQNQDITVLPVAPTFHDEHYALYRRYQQQRHPDGGMDEDDEGRYMQFLASEWCDTVFFEFREGSKLLGVAVVDLLLNGLSAMYTFYAPEAQHRGLGNYAILWQLEKARQLQLPYLYLGYWIGESEKMRYKSRFRPLEAFYQKEWRPIDDIL